MCKPSRRSELLSTCILVGLLIASAGCSQESQQQTTSQARNDAVEAIEGSGIRQQETRELDTFTNLNVEISAEIKIIKAETASVEIAADDNLLPILITEVSGGTLRIFSKQNYSTKSKVSMVISVPLIEQVSVHGSAEMFIDDVTEKTLSLTINGSGSIGGIGTVENLQAIINGSGDFLLHRLKAKNATINISGSGSAKVNTSARLSVTINGSGDVQYQGNPGDVKQSINGSGSVQAAN